MKCSNRNLLLSIIFLIVAVSTAHSGVTPLYFFTGEAAGDLFGSSVASAGDINNDGFDDLIVGAWGNSAGGLSAGRVYIFSGLNGDTLYIFTGEAAFDKFGLSVASAGDVDNDGFADLIVGAPFNDAGGSDAGQAYVFSGRTGDTLYVFTGELAQDWFGHSVASAGDVNNDGFDDLIVGARHGDVGGVKAGRAYVFSGQTGETIYVFNGEASADQFSASVSSAGDVNNDGFDDLVVGAPFNDAGGSNAGRVYVFSGKTGDTLYLFTGEAAGDIFGRSVASAGDVNNDGIDDLVVGASSNDVGGDYAGRVYVFSGKTGDTLHVFTADAAGDNFGNSVASAGDVNSDGYDDLIVGAVLGDNSGTDNAGRAYVFSGRTGDKLFTFIGAAASDLLGFSVASAGDVNNDGFDDLFVGARFNDAGGFNAGSAYVYSGYDSSCCIGFRGDLNGDGDGYVANILDLNFLVDFIFRGSRDPGPCYQESDPNADGDAANILDLTFLVDFIFRGGPAPGLCP